MILKRKMQIQLCQAGSIVPEGHFPSGVVAPKPMCLAGRTITLENGSRVSFDWSNVILGSFGNKLVSTGNTIAATCLIKTIICRVRLGEAVSFLAYAV